MKHVLLINTHPSTGRRLKEFIHDGLYGKLDITLMSAEEILTHIHQTPPVCVVVDSGKGNRSWKKICNDVHMKYPMAKIILITNRSTILTDQNREPNYLVAVLDKTFDLELLRELIHQSILT